MGEHDVTATLEDRERRRFTKALLADLSALQKLIASGRFDDGPRRIGAEQEMFLVGPRLEPAPLAMQVLEATDDPRLTTELALYNIEANLTPSLFGGDCLRRLERELDEVVGVVREGARAAGGDVVLVGILPTLTRGDVHLGNMTPMPRYRALNEVLKRLRGGEFHVLIKGLDQLETSTDSVMFESCNTSFQIHFQVTPDEFAPLYNLAQLITAPVLAAAVNSPVMMRRRLWRETRIALFERSVDTRSASQQDRGQRPRVHFGDAWVRSSVVEIFQEDIARFPVVAAIDTPEDPLAIVAAGGVPRLRALCLHNGTIYRWNRPCYGITDGRPHLRIENRTLPAGPSLVDEVANAAFFFGLMAAMADEAKDVPSRFSFDDCRRNFLASARHGLDAQLAWTDGRSHSATDLVLGELLPRAREGLTDAKVDPDDVARYLDVLQARVETGRTGAAWMLGSLREMGEQGTPDLRERQIVRAIRDHQLAGDPVHTWALADLETVDGAWRESYRTVGQIMTTDLFTVRPDDIVDLAASVMDWRHIRHVPVEDAGGQLVGLVGHRALLRLVGRGTDEELPPVSSIMRADPVTVPREMPTLEAMHLMRERQVGCLLVVGDGKLVGIVTERDLIGVSAKLLEAFLQEG